MTVRESVDPTSFLTTPADGGDDFAAGLRWNAGLLIGSVDWIVERFLGYSLLSEVVIKPFAGDWTALERGADAWNRAGLAAGAVATNYSALSEQTTYSWTGLAGDAFRARMISVGAGFADYGDGCTAVGQAAKALVELSKAVAEAIATLLSFVNDILMRIAAELAVPVAGWVIGAFDVAAHIRPVATAVTRAYALLNRIMGAIERLTPILVSIRLGTEAIRHTQNTLAASARIQTVNLSGRATERAFGLTP